MNLKSGFSLIDLMVTIAITAILASIAIPNYMKFIERAKDVEAKAFIGSMFTSQKVYFVLNNGYTNNFFALGASLEGTLAFDCGLNDAVPAIYGREDITTYSNFAAATYLYCPLSGRCTINIDKHGPGGQNPQGDVDNTTNPPSYFIICHRHNLNGELHQFRGDSTGRLFLELDAF